MEKGVAYKLAQLKKLKDRGILDDRAYREKTLALARRQAFSDELTQSLGVDLEEKKAFLRRVSEVFSRPPQESRQHRSLSHFFLETAQSLKRRLTSHANLDDDDDDDDIGDGDDSNDDDDDDSNDESQKGKVPFIASLEQHVDSTKNVTEEVCDVLPSMMTEPAKIIEDAARPDETPPPLDSRQKELDDSSAQTSSHDRIPCPDTNDAVASVLVGNDDSMCSGEDAPRESYDTHEESAVPATDTEFLTLHVAFPTTSRSNDLAPTPAPHLDREEEEANDLPHTTDVHSSAKQKAPLEAPLEAPREAPRETAPIEEETPLETKTPRETAPFEEETPLETAPLERTTLETAPLETKTPREGKTPLERAPAETKTPLEEKTPLDRTPLEDVSPLEIRPPRSLSVNEESVTAAAHAESCEVAIDVPRDSGDAEKIEVNEVVVYESEVDRPRGPEQLDATKPPAEQPWKCPRKVLEKTRRWSQQAREAPPPTRMIYWEPSYDPRHNAQAARRRSRDDREKASLPSSKTREERRLSDEGLTKKESPLKAAVEPLHTEPSWTAHTDDSKGGSLEEQHSKPQERQSPPTLPPSSPTIPCRDVDAARDRDQASMRHWWPKPNVAPWSPNVQLPTLSANKKAASSTTRVVDDLGLEKKKKTTSPKRTQNRAATWPLPRMLSRPKVAASVRSLFGNKKPHEKTLRSLGGEKEQSSGRPKKTTTRPPLKKRPTTTSTGGGTATAKTASSLPRL